MSTELINLYKAYKNANVEPEVIKLYMRNQMRVNVEGYSHHITWRLDGIAFLKPEYLPHLIRRFKEVGKSLEVTIREARDGESSWIEVQDVVGRVTSNTNVDSFFMFRNPENNFQGRIPVKFTNMMESIVGNNEESIDESNLTKCLDCGALIDTEDGEGHHVHNHGTVCENCIGDYIWSETMEEYLKDDDVERFYPSESSWEFEEPDYVTRRWAQNQPRVYHSDYIDGFYDSNNWCPPDDDDEYISDDEDDYENDGLRDYHSSYREFVVRNENPNVPFKGAPALGVEIEVEAHENSRKQTVGGMKGFSNSPSCVGNLLFERDGSLCEENGFEIITDPLGYTEWQKMGPNLCRALDLEGCIAYQADGSYGIHITLERRHLTALQEARLMMFTTASQNYAFMKAIAQRESIYSADLNIGELEQGSQTINIGCGGLGFNSDKKRDAFGNIMYGRDGKEFSSKSKIYGRGKYSPINFKEELAEIRVFRSTLHPESFMKNIEWVYAMIEWVKSSTGTTWHHMDFVKWLGKRPHVAKDYPNLLNYLRRPEFGVRFSSRVKNTWASLLPLTKEELEAADDELKEAA